MTQPTVTLVAAPNNVQAGQPVTLTWTSADAASVSIDNGVGAVALNGSKAVTPTASCTYTATATGIAPSVTAAIPVTVTAAPPPPPPNPGSWPFTLPAPGTIGPISSNLLTDLMGGPQSTESFAMPSVLGSWGTAAQSIITDGPTLLDVIYWIGPAGGHGDTGWDGIACWRASTGKFEIVLPATTGPTFASRACPDPIYGESAPGRPDSQHPYQNVYGMDSTELGSAALMHLRGCAVGLDGGSVSGQAHRMPLATKTWSRFGPMGNAGQPGQSAFVKDRQRQRFVRYPSHNDALVQIFPFDGAAWTDVPNAVARDVQWGSTYEATGIHDPLRDLYLLGHWHGPTQFFAVPGGSPGAALAMINQTGAVPNTWGNGLQYRAIADEFLLVTSASTLHVGKLSGTFPNLTMTWTTRNFVGSKFANKASNTGEWTNRFQYIAPWDALIVAPAPKVVNFVVVDAPMECWKL